MPDEIMNRVKVEAIGVDDNVAMMYDDDSGFVADAYVAGAQSYRTLSETDWDNFKVRIAQDRWNDYGFTDNTKTMHSHQWKQELEYAEKAMASMGFIKKGDKS